MPMSFIFPSDIILSREKLALECDIDVKYLARIESCSANASLDVLDKLSNGTGIPAGILIGKEKN